MTNEVKINLSKAEVAQAIDEFVAKKYPSFNSESMYICESSDNGVYAYVTGKIKES